MIPQQSLFKLDHKELDLRHLSSVKLFTVKPVNRHLIAWFIEKWHYSGNINGVKDDYCFGLYYENQLIGAAMFGEPGAPGAVDAYTQGGLLQVTELRRLCCIDNTPCNTESYFIGQMIRWLRQNTGVDVILSYADLTYGHTGIIYKATNFDLIGQTAPVDKIRYKGKLYHDKALRVYNGAKTKGAKQKPFSVELARALARGEAERVPTKPKNIYLMYLHRKNRATVNQKPPAYNQAPLPLFTYEQKNLQLTLFGPTNPWRGGAM